jgi:hypothetical protein
VVVDQRHGRDAAPPHLAEVPGTAAPVGLDAPTHELASKGQTHRSANDVRRFRAAYATVAGMAVIHHTTLVPSKLELLAGWLPTQPWYADPEREPLLTNVGGFRLDDPEGEVGIEFMVVADGAATYQVPMTYRGAPREGDGLIGTTEHGVLGRRWIYDGIHDRALVAQLVALIQGSAQPQAQHTTDMADPSVVGYPLTDGPLAVRGFMVTAGDLEATELRVDAHGSPFTILLHRRLHADETAPCAGVSGTWRLPDGTTVRGTFATVIPLRPAARS